MGHKGKITDKFRKLVHHLFTGRSQGNHLVSDTGICFDKGTNPDSRVHQALKAIGDHAVLDQYRTDFNSPAAL
jgi:hypothetical protein